MIAESSNVEEEKRYQKPKAKTFTYPAASVNVLELDIIFCDEFLPQDKRLFAKEALCSSLAQAVSHESCVE